MAGVVTDIVASAAVKGGKLYFRNRRAFDQQVAQLKEGWQVEVSVTRLRATRSIQQNKWYWSQVVGLVADHTGNTPDDMHDLYKAKFLPRVISVPNVKSGEIVAEFTLGGSTRQMNTKEFGQYCDEIREWAQDKLGVLIPDPEYGDY